MTSRHGKKRDGNSMWCLCTLPIIVFPFLIIFWLHRSFSNEEFLQNPDFHTDKLGSVTLPTNDLRTLKEQTLFFESLLNMTKAPKRKSVVLVRGSEKRVRRDTVKVQQTNSDASLLFAADKDSLSRDVRREDESVYDERGEVVIVTPRSGINTKLNERLTYIPKDEKITGHDLLSAFFEQVVPDHMAGKLNVHIWQGICGPFVEQLRHSPLFPRFPFVRRFLQEFKSRQDGYDFGQRIFGFIHPEKQGFYEFAITSDDTSELWLSSDSNPKKSRLIAAVYSANGAALTTPYNLKKYPIQVSRKIELNPSKKFYIEALHKQSKGRGHVQVFWKEPGSKNFRIIQGSHLSLFVDDRELHDEGIIEDIDFQQYAPVGIPSHAKRKLDHSIKKILFRC